LGCASKTWSFSSACKNLGVQHPLGAEISFSEKCVLGGYHSTSRSLRSLDQTSPDLFRLTRQESASKSNSPILNIFILFGDIRRRTSKSSEIGLNFACFWPINFFWGRPPKILDRHYKMWPSSDHHAKFHAGRSTHLGDLALKKKTSGLKLKSAPQAIASGRTNK